jgi:hypothetical protein
MLRTSLQATEHDDDALVSLPASHTLAQIVTKTDKSFQTAAIALPVKAGLLIAVGIRLIGLLLRRRIVKVLEFFC